MSTAPRGFCCIYQEAIHREENALLEKLEENYNEQFDDGESENRNNDVKEQNQELV